jgi:hypothetical protein
LVDLGPESTAVPSSTASSSASSASQASTSSLVSTSTGARSSGSGSSSSSSNVTKASPTGAIAGGTKGKKIRSLLFADVLSRGCGWYNIFGVDCGFDCIYSEAKS